MKYSAGIIFFVFFLYSISFSQSKLRIIYSRLGIIKKYEFFEGDVLKYKVRGDKNFYTSRIVAMHDSSIVFESEDEIKLAQLKLIRFKKHSYHNKLFQRIFTYGAVGYPSLMLINGLITHNGDLPYKTAGIVSGSFIAGILILKAIGIKTIRMTDRKDLKIIDINYQNLNSK